MKSTIEQFWGAAASGVIAVFILWLAAKKGFFQLPQQEAKKIPLKMWHVLAAFSIYFGVAIFIAPQLISFLRPIKFSNIPLNNAIALSTWVNFLMSLSMALFLVTFCKALNSETSRRIWRKNPSTAETKSDIEMGILTWAISFPLVLSISQFLDLLVFQYFKVAELPEQVAVAFLKRTFSEPLYFTLSVFSIVILAPLIEELIFRGFLQTYIRNLSNRKTAIALSSICFSLFHYSPEQGLGNIPIIGSLLVLAVFLGYLYERQGSLLATISLHSCFNAISVINLYFLGGAPRGAL